MNLNGTTTSQPRSTLPAPLHTAADMPSHWDNVELDFDAAAQRIIEAHEKDGDAEDLPIADLKTWAVVPYEGQFALAPLTRHHAPKPLRAAAFSNLMMIHFISEGDQSDYIRKTLLDLEAHAKTEKSAIDAIKRQATKAVVLPAPDLVIQRALDLQRIAENEPLRAREAIRRLFEGGRLLVKPQPEGHYVAEGRLFPLALFTLDLSARNTPETPKAQPLSEPGLQLNLDPWSSLSCAGRI